MILDLRPRNSDKSKITDHRRDNRTDRGQSVLTLALLSLQSYRSKITTGCGKPTRTSAASSRCCTPRERLLVRARGHSLCSHSIAPIPGLPGSVPDPRAPSIELREVRTFRFG